MTIRYKSGIFYVKKLQKQKLRFAVLENPEKENDGKNGEVVAKCVTKDIADELAQVLNKHAEFNAIAKELTKIAERTPTVKVVKHSFEDETTRLKNKQNIYF